MGDTYSAVSNPNKMWAFDADASTSITPAPFFGDTITFDRCFYKIQIAYSTNGLSKEYSIVKYNVKAVYDNA